MIRTRNTEIRFVRLRMSVRFQNFRLLLWVIFSSNLDERDGYMKYRDGQEARLGDRIRVGGDSTGIVVCSIDTDDYTPEFPRDQWGYLGTGVMIQFTNYGLVHYTEPDEDLEFLGRASPDR
jgi:hypothetical protein